MPNSETFTDSLSTGSHNSLLYFAYGSNLHPLRLEQRVGRVSVVATASAAGFRLRFHKQGRDESGKCNIEFSGSESDCVQGALFAFSPQQRNILDEYESLGRGYVRERVAIETRDGPATAWTYIAMPEFVDDTLKPFHWYREFVCLGAEFHGFPPSYRRQLAAQRTIQDPHTERCRERMQMLSVLRRSPRHTGLAPGVRSRGGQRPAPPAGR